MSQQDVVPVSHCFGCDVIVIDDYEELATAISETLRRRGLSAQVILDGTRALALAPHCQPRVALVDCALPDGDGIQLIRQLRRVWPETIFLVVSGQVGGVSESMARELQIRAFLNKPLPLRVLAQAVEKLVRSSCEEKTGQNTSRSWFALGLGSPAASTADMALTAFPDRV